TDPRLSTAVGQLADPGVSHRRNQPGSRHRARPEPRTACRPGPGAADQHLHDRRHGDQQPPCGVGGDADDRTEHARTAQPDDHPGWQPTGCRITRTDVREAVIDESELVTVRTWLLRWRHATTSPFRSA